MFSTWNATSYVLLTSRLPVDSQFTTGTSVAGVAAGGMNSTSNRPLNSVAIDVETAVR